MSKAQEWFDKYRAELDKAVTAFEDRTFYSHFKEMPSTKVYGEDAPQKGLEAFRKQLENKFTGLHQAYDDYVESDELSPYTQRPLKISYPQFRSPEEYVEKGLLAQECLKTLSYEERAGILMSTLEELKNHFFELSEATQHTTGQGFMMAFQAGGPHALDRCLETIACGLPLLKSANKDVTWEKPMGKMSLKLNKKFRSGPRGLGVVIACSTFPVWNSLPCVFANFLTGNCSIVKPHPLAVYPLALCVRVLQEKCVEAGGDPHWVQLAVDKVDTPMALKLSTHPKVKMIDFTGSKKFGDELESLKGKITFTEKSGVNSVLLESTKDFSGMIQNLAFSLCLYSGQMCTSPQNIVIPEEGVKTESGVKTFEEVAQALKEAILNISNHPKMGAATLGALQRKNLCEHIDTAKNLGNVLLESTPLTHPQFAEAEVRVPQLVEVQKHESFALETELFGPNALLIRASDATEGLQLCKKWTEKCGALSFLCYTEDDQLKDRVETEMWNAGVHVALNHYGMVWVNQNAAFSDYHGSGANPAGNASIVDQDFVRARFVLMQSKEVVL